VTDEKVLRGWGEIESFTRESRKTLIKKGYPIRKDAGGSVWADPEEIRKHRAGISGNLWESLGISGNLWE
jgi:hypothetical protein